MSLQTLLESAAEVREQALADRDRIEELHTIVGRVCSYDCLPKSVKKIQQAALLLARLSIKTVGRTEVILDEAGMALDETNRTIEMLRAKLEATDAAVQSIIVETKDLPQNVSALAAELKAVRAENESLRRQIAPTEMIEVTDHDLETK